VLRRVIELGQYDTMIAERVDTHVHIFDRRTPLLETKWNPDGEEAPVDDLMAVFAAHGVSRGVISTSSIYGLHNDDFRQAMMRFPQLRATANVPLDIDAPALAKMGGQGFCGIRLLWRPLASVPDLRGEDWRPLLRRCADIGWHVHLTDRPERIGHTIEALEDAGVRVVIDHLGMIDTPLGARDPAVAAILRAVERGRTWVKLSGAFRFTDTQRARAAADDFIAAGGWDRVMWGSDWPFVGHMGKASYADALQSLDWVTDPAMRRNIESSTALGFYF
jgi:predicted TIM-barrel fold metal-dependent hydrolase